MYTLKIIVGDQHGNRRVISVDKQLFLIGSSDQCHLQITDTAVGLLHCAICSYPQFVALTDFGNWSGTTINGRFFRSGTIALINQDMLQLGATAITIAISTETESPRSLEPGTGFAKPETTSEPADSPEGAGRLAEPISKEFLDVLQTGRHTVVRFRSRTLPHAGLFDRFRLELFGLLEKYQTEVLGIDLLDISYLPSAFIGLLLSVCQRNVIPQLYRASSNVSASLRIARLEQRIQILDAPDWLK